MLPILRISCQNLKAKEIIRISSYILNIIPYLSSKTIYENDWKRHPQRVLISLLFPIWHTAIVSVIHYHGVHTLSLLLSSTSLVSLCRCPTPYRVSANL